MKTSGKRVLKVILTVIGVVLLLALLMFLRLAFSDGEVYFPLKDVRNDGAEYRVKVYRYYDRKGTYTITDDGSFLSRHRFDTWLVQAFALTYATTGDGIVYVYRNGELIFSKDFYDGDYHDLFIRGRYTKVE